MQERRAYMMKADVEGEYYAVKVVFFGELTAIGRYNSVFLLWAFGRCGISERKQKGRKYNPTVCGSVLAPL